MCMGAGTNMYHAGGGWWGIYTVHRLMIFYYTQHTTHTKTSSDHKERMNFLNTTS